MALTSRVGATSLGVAGNLGGRRGEGLQVGEGGAKQVSGAAGLTAETMAAQAGEEPRHAGMR